MDLVLLSTEPFRYVDRDDWLGVLGPARLVRTRSWGAVTERRFALPGGLELEICVGTPSWASTDPVDAGTRRVVVDGMRVLHDPDGRLAALAAACS